MSRSAWGSPKVWLADPVGSSAYAVSAAPSSPSAVASGASSELNGNVTIDESADLALALRLQDEFDNEQATLARQRGFVDPRAKIAFADDVERLAKAQLDADALAAQALSDELDEAEEPVLTEFDILVGQSFNRARATGAASAHSKHDIAVSNARNARQLVEKLNNCGDLTATGVGITNAVYNRLNERTRNSERRRIRRNETEDKAVVDRVLDQSTRLKLLALLNGGTLSSIGGVIAAGKESNVYHARGSSVKITPGVKSKAKHTAHEDAELAVKVFSVATHGFANRKKYMEGERRFGRNLANAHVNKFIKLWAEKEMRNLTRLRRVGVLCPRPVALREHVLVMTFVGRDGSAAPKLADAHIGAKKFDVLYRDCLLLMRTMFHDCSLVHSDLSEYNLLYDHGDLVVIDLSHAISAGNANASMFLREDCVNVTRFFARKGARVLTPRAAFEFVIDRALLGDKSDDNVLADDALSAAAVAELDAREASLMAEAFAADDRTMAPVVDRDSDASSDRSSLTSSSDVGGALDALDDSDIVASLANRAQFRRARALERLEQLIERDGQIGAFDKRALSAADAAFMVQHMPRSLHEVSDEFKFKAADVDTFGLLAPAQENNAFE